MTLPAGGYADVSAAITDGVLHYYPMRQADAAATVEDYVGTRDIAVANTSPGNTQVSGMFNRCRDLTANGTGTSHNWLEHAAGTGTDLTTWTVAFWFNPDSLTYTDQTALMETRDGSGLNGFIVAIDELASVDSFLVYFHATDTSYVASGLPTIGGDNLVVVTSDNASTTITAYLNNTEITSTAASSQEFRIATQAWRLGGATNVSTDTRYFDGQIDELTIWDRALTAAEVSTLWNNGYGFSVIDGADGYLNEVAEVVGAADNAVDSFEYLLSISDTVGLTQTSKYSFAVVASDILELTDSPVEVLTALATAADDLSADDDGGMTVMYVAKPVVSDTVNAADTGVGNMTVSAALADGVNFITALNINGSMYYGVVMNTRNSAVTEYNSVAFNSLAHTGPDEYMAAGADGIYLLDGSETDNGADIDSIMETGLLDFGSTAFKRCERAYLGVRNNGALVLKVTASDSVAGNTKTDWYELSETTEELRQRRIKVGKGLKSHYWQFKLISKDGASFELDNIEFVPIVLSRRV